MKDTFYFSHDYNARKDPKLIQLFMNEGMLGIGTYWCIIEMLYEQGGYLELSKLDIYAYELRIDTEILEKIIKKYNLFILKKNKVFSKSVLKRLGERQKRSDIARVKAEKRWNKTPDAVAMPQHKHSNAKEENSNASKVKESKGNKRKVKSSKENESDITTTTPGFIISYFTEKGFQNGIEASKFFEYNRDKKLEDKKPFRILADRWIANITDKDKSKDGYSTPDIEIISQVEKVFDDNIENFMKSMHHFKIPGTDEFNSEEFYGNFITKLNGLSNNIRAVNLLKTLITDKLKTIKIPK